MLNSNIDFSSIAYANSKSKLTLKTKKNLDELAKQVALWNQDSFYKRKDFIGGIKKMNLYPRRSRVIINDKSKSFYNDGAENDPMKTPVKIIHSGVVKKKAAFFESLTTPQRAPQNKTNYTPYNKILEPIPQENNILKDITRVPGERKDIEDLFEYNKENVIQNDNYNTQDALKNGTKENVIHRDNYNTQDILKYRIKMNVPQSNNYNTQDVLKHCIKENVPQSNDYNTQDVLKHCIKENVPQSNNYNTQDVLKYCIKENVPQSNDYNTLDVLNYCIKEKVLQSDDDSLPPPPSDYSDQFINDDSSITSEESISVINETDQTVKELSSSKPLTDEIEFKNDLNRSMSISHDIEDYLRKKYDVENPNTILPNVEKPVKKGRRSLSWSESIHYIDPSESECDNTDDIQVEEIDSLDISTRSYLQSTKMDQFNKNDESSCVNEYCSTVEYLDADDYNDADYILATEKASIYAKQCLTNVQNILNDPRNNLGGREHTASCVKLVKSCLIQQSLAERVLSRLNSLSVIEGYLEMNKILLNIKEGYVIIDYENLEKCNRGNDLRQLKKLYNVTLMVRSRGDDQIKSSMVYNIISKSEAYRLQIPHETVQWLEVFEYIRFNNLQPEFKFIFDLYCMEASPKKYNNDLQKKSTPLKKLWYYCRSSDKLQSPDNSGRSLFFTNLGSFTVTARGLNTNDKHTASISVPSESPFTGKLKFTTKFNMDLVDECQGRLNVFSDNNGLGTWSFYDCKLMTTSLLGWNSSNKDTPDLILPLHASLGPAQICTYTTCAKENSFSMILDPIFKLNGVPINRRKSVDGKNKKRFLAAAESLEDSSEWCNSINRTVKALSRWAEVLATDVNV